MDLHMSYEQWSFQHSQKYARSLLHLQQKWLIEGEPTYTQVEKETLVITLTCEQLSSYLLGLHLQTERDYRSLVVLLGPQP